MSELFPLLLLLPIMWFVVVRPQQKRQQEIRSMLTSLSVDDDVITIGGIYGTVVEMDDESVDLRVSASGLVLRFQKGAIARVVPVVVEEDSSLDEDSAIEVVDDRGDAAPALGEAANDVVDATEPADGADDQQDVIR